MKKSDSQVILDLDYHPLEKVAQILGEDVRSLIHLGGVGRLRVYTFANQWKTHVIEFGRDEQGNRTGEFRTQAMTLDHIQDGLVEIPWHVMKTWDAFWDDQVEFQLPSVNYVQYSLQDPSVEEACFPATFDEPQTIKLAHLFIKNRDLRTLRGEKDDQKPDIAVAYNTLLMMVIGMAVDGYGYDPAANKSPLPKQLETNLNLLGLSLTDDTIRRALQIAAKKYPSAKHHKS